MVNYEVTTVPMNELHKFHSPIFRVRDDEEMDWLVGSIRSIGVLEYPLVRIRPEGGYEILSGHRRYRACELLGHTHMKVIVRDVPDDDDAMLLYIRSNTLMRKPDEQRAREQLWEAELAEIDEYIPEPTLAEKAAADAYITAHPEEFPYYDPDDSDDTWFTLHEKALNVWREKHREIFGNVRTAAEETAADAAAMDYITAHPEEFLYYDPNNRDDTYLTPYEKALKQWREEHLDEYKEGKQ